MEKKSNRGGARPGAGRKTDKKLTGTLTLRIDAELLAKSRAIHGRNLGRHISDLLKSSADAL